MENYKKIKKLLYHLCNHLVMLNMYTERCGLPTEYPISELQTEPQPHPPPSFQRSICMSKDHIKFLFKEWYMKRATKTKKTASSLIFTPYQGNTSMTHGHKQCNKRAGRYIKGIEEMNNIQLISYRVSRRLNSNSLYFLKGQQIQSVLKKVDNIHLQFMSKLEWDLYFLSFQLL